MTPEKVDQTLAAAFERLNQVRAQRVPPHRDEKVVVAWNGLAMTALAQGSQVLGEPRYYEAAARAARFLLKELFRENTLYRIWTDGQVSVPGFREDYAHLANALLELYETDFDPFWLKEARRLMALMDEMFLDPATASISTWTGTRRRPWCAPRASMTRSCPRATPWRPGSVSGFTG